MGSEQISNMLGIIFISIVSIVLLYTLILSIKDFFNKRKKYRIVQTANGKFRVQKYSEISTKYSPMTYMSFDNLYIWEFIENCKFCEKPDDKVVFDTYESAKDYVSRLKNNDRKLKTSRKNDITYVSNEDRITKIF